MIVYKNKTALITGAWSGIGKGFADALGSRGANLVLVARSAGKLASVAKQIKKAYNTEVEVIAADLSKEKSADAVYKAVRKKGLTVDILINNAGFGTHGRFHTLPADVEQQEVALNCATLVRLTHLVLPGMLAKSEGIIVNVASTAAFQPVPYMAVYGATKAFVLSFSEALWAEYRTHNIRVLALCPGATDTNFFRVLGTEDAAVGKKRTIQGVVETGFKALERGKPYAIDGRLNYFLALSNRFAPRSQVAMISARLMKPKNA
jgi:uncharacterized protein